MNEPTATPAAASKRRHGDAPSTRRVLLEAEDLHKTYRLGRVDVPVLKGASINVAEGEWVAVLGASGSGKSTLLHLLGGLDRPDAGRGHVAFDGAPIASLGPGRRNRYRNRSVGFVFQFYHLLPELDVLGNAMLPAMIGGGMGSRFASIAASLGAVVIGGSLGAGVGVMVRLLWKPLAGALDLGAPSLPIFLILGAVLGGVMGLLLWPAAWSRLDPASRRRREKAEALLKSFGLGHRLHHRPRELSGGERQRVAIARALINEPRVLLADEPTGNLDEKTGAEILDILAQQHRRGLTIVMVTHDRAVAARADRIVELHDGRVVA